MLKNALIVGFSNAFGIASTFARGIILARILGPRQFGLAVIIIAITSALDMFADAGIDKFIIQNRFGYRSDIIRTSHAFRVFGSSAFGLAIVILAYPLSIIFRSPELLVPIALTGGVVSLRGLVDLSYKLQQREHRFETETIIDTARFSADLVTTALIAVFFHSFWAVIAGAYANALMQLTMSHLSVRGQYSFRPRQRLINLVGRFSLPIYLNAAILFAAVQGDRMVVAAAFSKPQLALYAAACAIGQGVTALLTKITMNMLLPIMSARNRPLPERRRTANQLGLIVIAISLLFMLVMSTVGPELVRILYGSRYTGLQNIIFASAIVQMIQIEQGWLTTLLMANGLTAQFPKITIMRASAFPAAALFIYAGLSILAIPLAFALGAAASLIVSYRLARPLGIIDRRLFVASLLRITLTIGAIGVLALR
jgi:O-antigen/teichoic acid export membrane protein